MSNEPADALSLCLLTTEPPTWQPDIVSQRLRERGEPAEVRSSDDPSQLLIVRHEDSETVVFDSIRVDASSVSHAERQTWDWPLAGKEAGLCSWSVLVADRRAKRLSPARRVRLMQQVVAALVETCPPGCCRAVHSQLCQRLIEPEGFVDGQRPGGDVLCGMVNVRLYRVTDQGQDVHLMDTLGLSALGLPDLQCVFRGLVPNDVAALLWDYAHYLFEKGDVIGDGDLIKGLQAEENWTAGRQESLTEPRRFVLDLYPGPDHGPGERGA